MSGYLSNHLRLLYFPFSQSSLRLLSPPSLAPRGACSLCAAIHQACHRSLRGGWRGLRGTRLISLLWLSQPAQRERAPATRAFAAPSSTSSSFIRSPFCQSNYCTPPFLNDRSTHLSTSCSPTQYKSARTTPSVLPSQDEIWEETLIKRGLSGSMGFPDCLTAIAISSRKPLKESPGGFWQLNKCGGQFLLRAAVKNIHRTFIYVKEDVSQREYFLYLKWNRSFCKNMEIWKYN